MLDHVLRYNDTDERGIGMDIAQGDFSITLTGQWTSPHTGAVYPMGWNNEIHDFHFAAVVDPQMEDQEFYESFLGSPKYWEGLCSVSGKKTGWG